LYDEQSSLLKTFLDCLPLQ